MQARSYISFQFLFLLAGFSTYYSEAFSQIPHYNFRQYTTANGLQGNKINAVYQDRQGFIWIGSDKGLNRFDGKVFEKNITGATNKKYFKLNDIQVIAENSLLLWAGTKQGGVVLFRNGKLYGYLWFDPRYPQQSLLSNEITALLPVHNNEMWVGTSKGISVFNNKQEHLINIDSSAVKEFNKGSFFITCLAQDSNNNIWAGTKEGDVIVFDGKTNKIVEHFTFNGPLQKDQDSSAVINFILTESKDTVFACTSKGLKKILFNRILKLHKTEDVPLLTNELDYTNTEVRKMIRLQDGKYWLATRGKGVLIAQFSPLQITHVKIHGSLRNNALLPSINEIYEDKEKGIWIGQDSDLAYYHPALQKFFPLNYAYGNNQAIKNVSSIYTEDHINLFLGTNNGLYLYNDNKEDNIPIIYKGINHPPQFFYCFYKDEEGGLLCGTDAGLKKIIIEKGVYIIKDAEDYPVWNKLKNNKISCITPFSDSLLFFGSAGLDGLLVWNKKINSVTRFKAENANPFSLPGNTVNTVFVDTKNRIFVGTNKGICMYNAAKRIFKNYPMEENQLQYNKPCTDFYDDGQNLWMSFEECGMKKFERSQELFSQGYVANPALNIYRLMHDTGGNIWASSNNGIIFINPYSDDHHTITNKTFKDEDGLVDIQFNRNAAFQKDGIIYFGSNTGLTRFRPATVFNDSGFSPPIAFTKVSATDIDKNVNTELDYAGKNISLSPWQKILQVEFAALSYVLPHQNEYSYWLEGLNKQWVNISNQQRVIFAYLPPGNYILHVRASNNNGTWNMEGAALKFTVQPHYWQTGWFKILLWMAIAALLFLIISLYTSSRLKKQKLAFEKQLAVQEERKRISSEIHDDIGAGLSSLRLYLDMLKSKLGNEPVNEEMEKASETAGELMEQVREIVWAFNHGSDTLESLLVYIRRYFSQTVELLPYTTKIHFPAFIPDIAINGEVRRSIFLCVKETITNIIRHAQATGISLEMSFLKNRLTISIKDNGKGFIVSEINKEHTGNGLINIQKRMEAIHGKCIFGHTNGTEVRLDIPLKT